MENAPVPRSVIEEIALLTPKELGFLATLFRRAYNTVLGSSPPTDLRTGVASRATSSVRRIASLAFQMPKPGQYVVKPPRETGSASPEYSFVSFTMPQSPNLADRIFTSVETLLDDFAAKGSPINYVLLNELALSFDQKHREELTDRWQQLATRREVYIIPGSYHCGEYFYNIAPIITPRKGRMHHVQKMNPAVQIEERIRTPDYREICKCLTDYGNILVWICLDLYDPALVIKLLSISHRLSPHFQHGMGTVSDEATPQILFVPSYNNQSSERISEMLESVSEFSNTAVFCANSWEERTENLAYLCGAPISPAHEYAFEADATKLKGKCGVYEFDMNDLARVQSVPFRERMNFSGQFKAIVNGEGAMTRLPD